MPDLEIEVLDPIVTEAIMWHRTWPISFWHHTRPGNNLQKHPNIGERQDLIKVTVDDHELNVWRQARMTPSKVEL